MVAKILDGKQIAKDYRQGLKDQVEALQAKGFTPKLSACLGSGTCTNIPLTVSSSFKRLSSPRTSASVAVSSKWTISEIIPIFSAALKDQVEALQAKGFTPKLSVILVGNDGASQSYVNSKKKAAEKIGMISEIVHLDETASLSV